MTLTTLPSPIEYPNASSWGYGDGALSPALAHLARRGWRINGAVPAGT